VEKSLPFPILHWQYKSDITPVIVTDWGVQNKSYVFKEVKVLEHAYMDATFMVSLRNATAQRYCDYPFRVGFVYKGYVAPDGLYEPPRLLTSGNSMMRAIEANGIPWGVRSNALNSHTYQINDIRLDLGVELRELPETLYFLRTAVNGPRTLIKGAVIGLTKAMSLFVKGDMRKAAKHLGIAQWWKYPKKVDKDIVLNDLNNMSTYTAQKWLELKYGWLPLVYTMQDAWDELQRLTLENGRYVKTYAGYKDKIPFTFVPDVYKNWLTSFHTSEGTLSRRFKSGNTWEITGMPTGVELGFTTGNLLNVAWQGTFLTFMIDAFWNIAGFLQALEAPRGAKWVDGYETEFLKFEGVYCKDFPKGATPGVSFNGLQQGDVVVRRQEPGRVEAVSFTRTRLTERPLTLPVPWFGRLDGEYYATVAALWKNFFLAPNQPKRK
jgi:hypothetical protein